MRKIFNLLAASEFNDLMKAAGNPELATAGELNFKPARPARFYRYSDNSQNAILEIEQRFGVGVWVFLADPDFRRVLKSQTHQAPGQLISDQEKRGYCETVRGPGNRIIKFRFIKKAGS